MNKPLTQRQIDWFTQLRLKEADFIIGKKINYSPALHDFIIDKAMCKMSDYEIAKIMHIKPQVFYNWLKLYPQLKEDLFNVRKTLVEMAHTKNALGEYSIIDTTTKYDGDDNVIHKTVTEKGQGIDTISLDRLAQKYAPELAPKEKVDIDVDINVKHIDFSRIDKLVESGGKLPESFQVVDATFTSIYKDEELDKLLDSDEENEEIPENLNQNEIPLCDLLD
jgi:hypothetical protein